MDSIEPPIEETAGFLSLHEVLFEELGQWDHTPADKANERDYQAAAARARSVRSDWLKLLKVKPRSEEQCETAYEAMRQAEDDALKPLYKLIHGRGRSALCLSGGGIRSATFSLGVLHALAKYSFPGEPGEGTPRLLAEFDYLSTVSGGGYIGSWLSSWIRWEGGTAEVVRELAQTPENRLTPEPKPLQHLRDYSNYLNPRLGLLSADTWTLAATTLRNIFLNWLVLIPFFAAVLLTPQLMRDALRVKWGPDDLLFYAGFVLGVLGVGFVMHNLPSFGDRRNTEQKYLAFCILPLLLSAFCLSAWWWNQPLHALATPDRLAFAKFGAAVHGSGVILGALLSVWSKSQNFSKGHFQWQLLFFSFLAAIGTGALGAWLMSFVASDINRTTVTAETFACLGMPLVFAALALVGAFSVGISSRITTDEDREWWSRAGAWLLIVAIGWVLFSCLVLLVPGWIATWVTSGKITFASVAAAMGWWATHSGASAKSGDSTRGDQSAQTGSNLSSRLFSLSVPAAAILFLLALAVGITLLNGWLEQKLGHYRHWLVVLEVALAIGVSYGVNVNKFSLHAMYRMRLIRAYLGASNKERDPNPFTGFDEEDNAEMHTLSKDKPLHVVNVCLNLVHGSKLAWQQRKAESFTFSRLHSGSFQVGYQPSRTYAKGVGATGVTLGTAMTISGAAASPNMGYRSSPLAAIVMTLFNARLGWWLTNPGEPGRRFWERSGPVFGVRPFLDEAFGNTNDTNRYVYLSDGGHFENLGIYEMVLRRCHFIVVIDAGADPDYTKEDLGNAVRKIRIDLGIPIEFSSKISIDRKLGDAGKHCAVGTIHYECVDTDAVPGKLLYIKPVLNGNESEDVLNYGSANTTFPQQSTADQWFDESQFESYRRLGAHSIEEIFDSQLGNYGVEDLIRKAHDYAAATHKHHGRRNDWYSVD